MLNQKTITSIDFGAPAAERDLDGLAEYFYETDSYKRMVSGKKSVLLGNRGTGKSAIFKVLAENLKKQGFLITL